MSAANLLSSAHIRTSSAFSSALRGMLVGDFQEGGMPSLLNVLFFDTAKIHFGIALCAIRVRIKFSLNLISLYDPYFSF